MKIYPKSSRYRMRTRVNGYTKTVIKKGKKIKVRRPKEIIQLAHQLEKQLKPYSDKIEIVGSIIREKEPSDIDIILIPTQSKTDEIKQLIAKKGEIKSSGEKQIFSKINGVDTDIFFVTKSDFGAQKLYRTGPYTSNINKANQAKKLNLKFNQYGVWAGNNRIAGKTEKEVFEALHLKYKQPKFRGINHGKTMV